MYVASVHGLPAKPMSGSRSPSSRRMVRIASITNPRSSSGSGTPRRSMSAGARTGARNRGPSPSTNSRPESHRPGDGQDVGEQDRRIEREPVQRLQGDLARELRGAAQRKEAAGARPRRPIFGEIATGLAHEPDRRTVDGFPRKRPQQTIIHRSRPSSGPDRALERCKASGRAGCRRLSVSPTVQVVYPVLRAVTRPSDRRTPQCRVYVHGCKRSPIRAITPRDALEALS